MACLSGQVKMLAKLIIMSLIIITYDLQVASGGKTFVIVNSCEYTIWPGISSNSGGDGFELAAGQSVTIQASSSGSWSGRIWARTGCSFNGGSGRCATGDCGGSLKCGGLGATPPVSLVEFTLGVTDYYDLSLVDGYNVGVSVAPEDADSCSMASCSGDKTIKEQCPASMRVLQSDVGGVHVNENDGQQAVVACKSACLAFGSAQYCCSGAYASPATCPPTSYSRFFKAACPDAYSYAYDDATSTFTCSKASSYTITFCPSSSSSFSSSSSSSSSPSSSSSTSPTTVHNSSLGQFPPPIDINYPGYNYDSPTGTSGSSTYDNTFTDSGSWQTSTNSATGVIPSIFIWPQYFTVTLLFFCYSIIS